MPLWADTKKYHVNPELHSYLLLPVGIVTAMGCWSDAKLQSWYCSLYRGFRHTQPWDFYKDRSACTKAKGIITLFLHR